MKNALRFAILLVVVAGPLLATAQKYCGMYTYSDQWSDENNNLVALNHTDADPCGDYYYAYADVEIRMPSGYSQSASGDGAGYAQAIALGPMSEGEVGDGLLDGTNAVDFGCAFASFPFSLPIRFNAGEEFIWYDEPVLLPGLGKCGYTRVDHCTKADGIYCGDAFPSIIYACLDSTGRSFTSVLVTYGYAEVQIGSRVFGGCLREKSSSGSGASAGMCSAIPPHL